MRNIASQQVDISIGNSNGLMIFRHIEWYFKNGCVEAHTGLFKVQEIDVA